MATMTRAQFPRELQYGLHSVFGTDYDRWAVEWKDIYDDEDSEKAYEEMALLVGLGSAIETREGDSITFDAGKEGWIQRFNHRKTTISFRLTQEALDDNLYVDLGRTYAKSAARGMRFKEEVDAVNVLNNGFNNSGAYNGGDGVPLFWPSHPQQGAAVLANTFGSGSTVTNADMSEESIEDACIAIEGFTDDRGIPMRTMPKRIVHHRQNAFVAQRILYSTLRVGTTNNDANALRDMKSIPQGSVVNHYLADPGFWMIHTDCPQGFMRFQRKKVEQFTETDFATGDYMCKLVQRYSQGWVNHRCAFASTG